MSARKFIKSTPWTLTNSARETARCMTADAAVRTSDVRSANYCVSVARALRDERASAAIVVRSPPFLFSGINCAAPPTTDINQALITAEDRGQPRGLWRDTRDYVNTGRLFSVVSPFFAGACNNNCLWPPRRPSILRSPRAPCVCLLRFSAGFLRARVSASLSDLYLRDQKKTVEVQ